jgi:inosine-uridine nucleoside N-ribohydrolase
VALVKKKARLLVVMGGQYPSGKEWNFEQDGAAAKKVCEEWPTPAVFSGGEVGSPIGTGARLAKETLPENPVRKAYELYNGAGKNRSSWDQTAMLYAIRGEAGLFTLSPEGTNAVAATGKNDWKAAAGGRHRYLIKAVPDAEIAKAIDELMLRPPAKK